MEELVIKVPAPFSGVGDVGFSARYPAQPNSERLRDVPFIVEGPPRPMHILVERLALFADKDRLLGPTGDDDAYLWTQPVQLTDEVCVIACVGGSGGVAQLASAGLNGVADGVGDGVAVALGDALAAGLAEALAVAELVGVAAAVGVTTYGVYEGHGSRVAEGGAWAPAI